VIDRICAEFTARYELCPGAGSSEIDIIDGYVGRGYAKSRPEELACIRDLARRDALILDPVYTGKAFCALTQELAKNRSRFADRIVSFMREESSVFPAAELARCSDAGRPRAAAATPTERHRVAADARWGIPANLRLFSAAEELAPPLTSAGLRRLAVRSCSLIAAVLSAMRPWVS
jgi:hypothetical protein